jgi:hypothetical protein
MSTDSVQSIEPVHSTGEVPADTAESKARSADAAHGQAVKAPEEPSAKGTAAAKAVPWWRRARVWAPVPRPFQDH